jgi:hypothetical protein
MTDIRLRIRGTSKNVPDQSSNITSTQPLISQNNQYNAPSYSKSGYSTIFVDESLKELQSILAKHKITLTDDISSLGKILVFKVKTARWESNDTEALELLHDKYGTIFL